MESYRWMFGRFAQTCGFFGSVAQHNAPVLSGGVCRIERQCYLASRVIWEGLSGKKYRNGRRSRERH